MVPAAGLAFTVTRASRVDQLGDAENAAERVLLNKDLRVVIEGFHVATKAGGVLG